MKNEKLKNCIDDALSDIREDPWLLGKVLSRAENKEDLPVKKKISLGTVLIVLVIVLLMSVGIAAVSGWNALDFLNEWEDKPAPYIMNTVQQESETENARLKVESVVYDGETLAFDMTLENKHPEVPMWCWVETLAVNGDEYEPGIIYDSDRVYSSGEASCGFAYSLSDFTDQWLPGWEYPEAIAQCGERLRLPPRAAGKEVAHVELRVTVFRPIRPVALIDMQGSFRKEVEQKISEGYYPIPGYKLDGKLYPEGQFCPEEDLDICPGGWSILTSGPPEEDLMGGMTVETLEISFDAPKTELVEGTVHLQPQESYENEYCTAVFEKAQFSPRGLELTLRVKPKNDQCVPKGFCRLADGEGNRLTGSSFFPDGRERFDSEDHEGEMIWQYRWKFLQFEELPDTIALTCTLENGEELYFPVKVR